MCHVSVHECMCVCTRAAYMCKFLRVCMCHYMREHVFVCMYVCVMCVGVRMRISVCVCVCVCGCAHHFVHVHVRVWGAGVHAACMCV